MSTALVEDEVNQDERVSDALNDIDDAASTCVAFLSGILSMPSAAPQRD